MANESVFEYLERMKRADKALMKHPNTRDCEVLNLALPKYIFPDKQLDDLGGKIEAEFESREGGLTEDEISLALEYFSEDYQRAQNNAVRNFEMVQRRGSSSDEYREYLKKSWDLTIRATRDVELARKLNPEVNVIMPEMDYQIIFDALQNFREQLYLATEFPTHYKEIIPLHWKMKKAVKQEDYEIMRGWGIPGNTTDFIFGLDDPFSLNKETPATLSKYYRHIQLAKRLKLNLNEWYQVLQLTENPLETVENIHAFIEQVQKIKTGPFSIDELLMLVKWESLGYQIENEELHQFH
ncbi:MAG: hypothetical protein IID32_03885 [Planctomycetes bacterium]|nr:hypothetical protein [Planctomycetota bacterium]